VVTYQYAMIDSYLYYLNMPFSVADSLAEMPCCVVMLNNSTGVSVASARDQSPPLPPPQADSLAPTSPAPPDPPSLSPISNLPPSQNKNNFSDSPLPDPLLLAQNLRNYFFSARKNKEVHSQILLKNGDILDDTKIVPLPPPQLSEFLRSIPLSLEAFKTLYDENKVIRDAVLDCKMVLKEFLIENGLLGLYDANFAKYIANIELNMVASLGTIQVTHIEAPTTKEVANRRYKKRINKTLSFIESSNKLSDDNEE